MTKECISEELERLRKLLNGLVSERKSLVDPDVVALSQIMDRVVLHYYKKYN